MSFDLYFRYRPGAAPMTWAGLRSWAEEAAPLCFQLDGAEEGGLLYENPHTGVYFTLYWSMSAGQTDPEGVEVEDLAEGAEAPDLARAPVSFNLNFCRPSYFGAEALAVAAALAEVFALDTVDPQGSNAPEAPDAAALVASWTRTNAWAAKAIGEISGQRPTMATADAMAWWRYMRDYPRLVEAMEVPGGFAPRVFLITCGDGRVLRAAVLTRPTMYVLPPVDVFIIERDEERAYIRAEDFRTFIAPYVTEGDPDALGHPWVSESTVYGTDVMETWDAFYDRVEVLSLGDDIEGVAPDGFIDLDQPA